MSDFLNKISHCFESLTNSQKTVAIYLMDNLDNLAFYTLEDLAAEIGVSTTTIIRFARVLGYNGYSGMQKDIQHNIKYKAALPERLDAISTTKDQLLHDSFMNDIKNIQETLASLPADSLTDAIQMISSANNIYILGIRSSFSLAHYLTSRLGQIKKHVRLIQAVGMIYPEEIVSADKGDVCIAYLFPRYSKMTATIISWLKKYGVKIILITSSNHSSINKYADILLPCSVSGISLKNSFAAPICLTNYIVAALTINDYEGSKQVLERTEEILNQGYYFGL